MTQDTVEENCRLSGEAEGRSLPDHASVHLMRFPSVNRISFLECSGNGFHEWRQPTGKDVQQTHGLLSGTE